MLIHTAKKRGQSAATSLGTSQNTEPPLRPPLIAFVEGDGSDSAPDDDEYAVKGLMHRGHIGTLVGPSHVGKSFLALWIAFMIALGHPWLQGCRVRRGAVLYIGYEGNAGLRNRIAAAYRAYGDPGRAFAYMLQPPLLGGGREGDKGVARIVAAIHELERESDLPIGLIIIDTKHLATAGDDEDKATDVGAYIRRLKGVVAETGTAVMTVHHTGKDPERGARGSSALFAGDDFHIRIDKMRNVEVIKARDSALADGRPWFSFDLDPIELRTDADGDPVMSCVVKAKAAQLPGGKGQQISGQAATALRLLEAMFEALGDDDAKQVSLAEWKHECQTKRISGGNSESAQRTAFERARKHLETEGFITVEGDVVRLRETQNAGRSE